MVRNRFLANRKSAKTAFCKEFPTMAHYNTVFHTLAKILPRHEIDRLDRKYGQGDKRRKSSRYVLFIVMLIAQILGLKSLREIEQAQKIKQKRLCHLGVKSPVSRSALSRMNDERSADFFKDVFQQMLQSCKALAPGSQFKLPGVNSLILMDATTIQLCLDVFPWATYTQTKGALKLHFGLNDDGYLPDFMVATTGKVHEINVAKSLDYQPGSMICMDRGYTDYDWWEELTRKGIYFVTRLKSNAVYDEIRRRVGRRSKNIVDDETIKLKGIQTPFRLIDYISPEDQHEYHFITNAMHLPAQTIADIYKERWQIELFFKWVKQNLKIKTFLGISANAVMTQVWVALCLYLILAFIRFISKTVHSMHEILNWIRINLFSNEILDDYLIPKMTEPIVNPQLALF